MMKTFVIILLTVLCFELKLIRGVPLNDNKNIQAPDDLEVAETAHKGGEQIFRKLRINLKLLNLFKDTITVMAGKEGVIMEIMGEATIMGEAATIMGEAILILL